MTHNLLQQRNVGDLSTKFAQNGAAFALELFQQLSTETKLKENFIFSPLSVQCCIALAFAGSSGETAAELVKGLNLVSTIPVEVSQAFKSIINNFNNSKLVKIGNKVYVKDGYKLKSQYENTVKDDYLAEVENINFGNNVQAAKIINDWVTARTAGKIKHLICADALSPLTGLVLLNAIHFKGQWRQKFDEKDTKDGEFWVDGKNSVKLPFMRKKAKFQYGIFENLNCSALEMPYKDSNLSMLILLPNEREGLVQLVKKLKSISLLDLTKEMEGGVEVVVHFPKFKVDYFVHLKDTLQKMGINKMFGPSAEFDNMLESSTDLYASEIVHKAIIEVNEEGTEAAAATGVVMMMRCLMIETEFVADHPFLYIIWDRKNILFTGVFVDRPSC